MTECSRKQKTTHALKVDPTLFEQTAPTPKQPKKISEPSSKRKIAATIPEPEPYYTMVMKAEALFRAYQDNKRSYEDGSLVLDWNDHAKETLLVDKKTPMQPLVEIHKNVDILNTLNAKYSSLCCAQPYDPLTPDEEDADEQFLKLEREKDVVLLILLVFHATLVARGFTGSYEAQIIIDMLNHDFGSDKYYNNTPNSRSERFLCFYGKYLDLIEGGEMGKIIKTLLKTNTCLVDTECDNIFRFYNLKTQAPKYIKEIQKWFLE
jgi:hypothetical protein